MLYALIFGMQDEMYPDARMYSCEGTPIARDANIPIGILYLTVGIICQLCYIPCIIVILQSSLIKMPCFKIMVYLGIIDISCLFICADLAGYWSIVGLPYCANPVVSYVLGNVSMGLWSASCFCVVFLAVNRATDLIFPSLNHIFEGRRMFFWLLLPSAYFCYFTFFERPLLYSPAHSTFFFDPLTNYSKSLPPKTAVSIYANDGHSINNCVVILSLLSLYLIMLSRLYYKLKICEHMFNFTTKQLFLQLFVICGCHVLGGFLYVYTQFFPVPAVFTVITNMAWIGNHGLPGLVYLTLNRTIRDKVLVLLGIRSHKQIVRLTGGQPSPIHCQVTF